MYDMASGEFSDFTRNTRLRFEKYPDEVLDIMLSTRNYLNATVSSFTSDEHEAHVALPG